MAWSGPTNGLIHRWPLDLVNLSGGVDADVVGTINITESGTITSNAGPNGAANAARFFDGSTGFGTFASSPLPSSGAYTVSLWLMTPDVTRNSGTLTALTAINFGTNASGSQLRAVINNGTTGGLVGDFAWQNQASSNGQETNANFIFKNSVFGQAAITFDGVSAYQTIANGIAVSTVNSGLNAPAADDEIGQKGASVGFYYGAIAQLVIYNRVLTAAELIQLFNADASIPALPTQFWCETE